MKTLHLLIALIVLAAAATPAIKVSPAMPCGSSASTVRPPAGMR